MKLAGMVRVCIFNSTCSVVDVVIVVVVIVVVVVVVAAAAFNQWSDRILNRIK